VPVRLPYQKVRWPLQTAPDGVSLRIVHSSMYRETLGLRRNDPQRQPLQRTASPMRSIDPDLRVPSQVSPSRLQGRMILLDSTLEQPD
jgi:hypothetical protein